MVRTVVSGAVALAAGLLAGRGVVTIADSWRGSGALTMVVSSILVSAFVSTCVYTVTSGLLRAAGATERSGNEPGPTGSDA